MFPTAEAAIAAAGRVIERGLAECLQPGMTAERLLDRFNSLLFAAPAALHYVGYFRGIGLDQPTRILTGGG